MPRRLNPASSRGARIAVCLAVLGPFIGPPSIEGQQSDETAPAVDTASNSISPAGAFLRGVLVPGWGHLSSGTLGRGAFYFGVEATASWMLFKTARRLRTARERLVFWERVTTERLIVEGVTGDEALSQALDEDPQVVRARGLVQAREGQREDWLAVGLFFLLISGVDAFVSAHLQDFPEPLTIEPSPEAGGVELTVRVPQALLLRYLGQS